jgi:hypothetical protein
LEKAKMTAKHVNAEIRCKTISSKYQDKGEAPLTPLRGRKEKLCSAFILLFSCNLDLYNCPGAPFY